MPPVRSSLAALAVLVCLAAFVPTGTGDGEPTLAVAFVKSGILGGLAAGLQREHDEADAAEAREAAPQTPEEREERREQAEEAKQAAAQSQQPEEPAEAE